MSQEEAQATLEYMREAGMPDDREAYIRFNWAGLDASQWDAEHESQLPEELQDWSLFETDDYDGLKYIGPKPDTGYHGDPEDEETVDFGEGDEDEDET